MTATRAVATLFGRERETRRVLQAIHRRESLLIWGPAGAGKSALLHGAIAAAPYRIRARCIWIDGAKGRKQILRQIVGALHQCRDGAISSVTGWNSYEDSEFQRWLARQTSRGLGGLAAEVLRDTGYWLVLDHFPPATHAMARLLSDFMRRCKTPVYLTARGHSRKEIGDAWKLYWNPERWLELGPLTESAAKELFDSCSQAGWLDARDLEKARMEILRASGKIPGAIRAMCALAREPRFQAGGRIKTRLLRTEYLIGFESKQDGIFPDSHAPRSQP